MRVLVTIFQRLVPISGGGTPRFKSIIDVLVEKGHEVSVAASLNVDVEDALKILRCDKFFPLKDISRFDKNKMVKYLIYHPLNISKVIKEAMRTKPEVIVAHDSISGLASLLAKKVTGCLAVVYIGDLLFELLSSYSEYVSWTHSIQKIGRKLENKVIQQADKIISVSNAMRDELVQRGAQQEKVDVVYDGVNVDLFRPKRDDAIKLRKKYAAGAESVVMCHGVIDPQDHLEILVDAAVSILKEHPHTVFWLVGDGAAVPEIKEMVKRTGIEDHFFFSGWIPYEDVPSFISACDVGLVILPNDISARVKVTLKTFEYWACEKPIVVSDLPALREVVSPWRTGLFYKPEDSDDLAKKVCLLLEDRNLCRDMGRAGRQLVERRFNWNALATEFVSKIGI